MVSDTVTLLQQLGMQILQTIAQPKKAQLGFFYSFLLRVITPLGIDQGDTVCYNEECCLYTVYTKIFIYIIHYPAQPVKPKEEKPMTTLRWLTLPFSFTTTTNFYEQLNRWLSEVFYSVLPQEGFEVREEQIYSCYRMVNAFREKGVLMAEAGSGTGKTFAYLLPALCYARLRGQPVAIACSSAALQEQLVSEEGDINTLSHLLDLGIMAVLAKDPSNYICAVQADLARRSLPKHPQRKLLLHWLTATNTGDRIEIPEIDDELWAEVAFSPSLDCRHCRRRGYCHQARARQRLWQEQDFIICSHDVFFHDLWTRRQRMQKVTRLFSVVQTKVPYLPPYSAVVLDEAHLIEKSALKNLGIKLSFSMIKRIIEAFSAFPLVSDGLLKSLENLEKISKTWFAEVIRASKPVTETQAIISSIPIGSSQVFLSALDTAMEEIAMYQQHDITEYIQDLELFSLGLHQWLEDEDCIAWWETGEERFWVGPRDFSQALGRELLALQKPIIFTSATLDANDEFAYFKRITGVQGKTSQVTTSFNLAAQMKAWVGPYKHRSKEKASCCASLLHNNGGRALILCNSDQELAELKGELEKEAFPFKLLWEGTGDRGGLVEQFRRDVSSVLIGTSFWEGIDIPGPALTLIIVYSLPFPIHDPLTLAKRETAAARGMDPDQTIDLPAMGIKLRQGLGRLIRSCRDKGGVAILEGGDTELRQRLISLLPPDVPIVPHPDQLLGK